MGHNLEHLVVAGIKQLFVSYLGAIGYTQALALQRSLHEARVRGEVPDILLLLEHPPTFTIGRHGDGSHLLVSPEELWRLGADLHWTDRGGDITFHGPGQLVGYPILYLGSPWPDLPAYLRQLERALIATVGELGVEARAVPGFTGVWAGREKLAALGAKVTRGVTMHGFSLNVNVDLTWFDLIHPCGLVGRKATSLARLLGQPADLELVARLVAEKLGRVFGQPFNAYPFASESEVADASLPPLPPGEGWGEGTQGLLKSALTLQGHKP